MKKIYIMLFTSFFITEALSVNAGRGNKNNARSSSRKSGNIRASASSTDKTISETSSTTSSSDEKDTATCEQIFYKCMDEKTNESVMSNELVYDNYSDMLSEIYSGMTAPAFKCIYSKKVKDLYSKYYFGYEISAPISGKIDKIKNNSIEYYNYLKNNATQVANKKLSAYDIDREVLSLSGIKTQPKNLSYSSNLPDVSYKITTIDPNILFNENVEYCIDVSKNEEFKGCNKLKKSVFEKYNELNPSVNKSCKDYEVFLSQKLSEAKSSTISYIQTLKTKLENVISEYNLKEEAKKDLEKINESDSENNYQTSPAQEGHLIDNKKDTNIIQKLLLGPLGS